ncbi:MAG: hypothetical protein AABY79_05710 [Nitrospirota bacterium]|jgi:hypothetical protein
MKGDKISDQDYVARYCKPTTAPNGQIQATAFMLRKGEESLSVNWLEFFKCSNRLSEIAELRKTYHAKLNNVGAGAKIAVLNVGEVLEKVRAESPDGRNIEALHDPEINDQSHSGIYNLKQDDELIAELICETVRETYPARK